MSAPHTYTFSQYHQHTGGDAAGYNKYLRYVANFRANRISHLVANPINSDALAPIPESTQVPKLHQMVNQQFAPLINQENKNYQQNLGSARNAVTGYTTSLAQFYKPQSQQMMDNTAVANSTLAGTGAALHDTLQGGPVGLGDLSHYLGASGGQTTPVANYGTTGANTLAARVASQVGQNTGLGVAGANVAAFLPTAAAQGGGVTLNHTVADLNLANQKNLAGLRAQEPSAFQKLYQGFINQEIQKAVARNSGYDSQLSSATSAAKGAATQARADRTYATTTHAETNPTTGKPQAVKNGWHLNKQGIPVKDPTPSSKPVSGPGSTRYKGYQSAIAKATTTVKQIVLAASKPTATTKKVPNPLGAGLPPISQKVTTRIPNYYGTLHKVIATISPLLSPYMGPADITRFAQRIVNGYYEPGQYGRPGRGLPRGK